MRVRLIPVLLIASYGLLLTGSILHPVYAPGARSSEVLTFIALLAVVAAVSILGRTPPSCTPPPSRWDLPMLLLLAILYLSFVMQAVYGMDIGNRDPQVQKVGVISLIFGGLFLLPYFALVPPEKPCLMRIRRLAGPAVVAFVLALGVFVKVDGIVNEPRASIDVWEIMQSGGTQLMEGRNPYSTRNLKAEAAGRLFGNPPSTYVYPPSVLLLSVPVVKWFGDVRYLYVIADLAAACLLLLIGRRLGGGARMSRYAELAAVLVMFHPRSFAKAWNDPLIVPFFFGYALAYLRAASGWVQAVLGGFTISLKQYLAFMAPLIAVRLKKPRLILIATAAGAAAAIPFVIWDFGSLYNSTIVFHFKTPFREDGMTISSFLFHVFGYKIPSSVGALTAFALTVAACWYTLRRGLTGTVVWSAAIFLALFANSSYAFPNYYHFVMGVLILGAILTLSERNGGTADSGNFPEGPLTEEIKHPTDRAGVFKDENEREVKCA